MYRDAKTRLKDPVLAWADVTSDPERRRRYQQARGKGGLVRSSWREAVEMIAAAYMNTIKTYGPDRVAGFSPIPAMSMVSHCIGTRFTQLIGGVMTSFCDWYADLPVASPQVFGDQTDAPESGDWCDATYLMMWDSNVPVTRSPDAHWMTEVRYRGTKVVTISPDYADNTKFADEWLPAQAGTDVALAMAMGQVILKGFFVDRKVPTAGRAAGCDVPMVLATSRRLEHYDAGTMTRRTANLALLPTEYLDLHPADAARLDVRDGTEIVVSSQRGRIQVGVRLPDEVLPGQVFLAFHFPDAAVDELTSGWTDDVTSCPEYKVTAVSVQPA